ncbi:hypothetical protein [Paraburkholderia sprentiae]|nr:hypothetical protein [Paraburkholderia sprentiae]
MQLRQRLDRLPHKSPERAARVGAVADLYGVSATSVYRPLHQLQQPHSAHRAGYGKPRVLKQPELERYCEVIAALKVIIRVRARRQFQLVLAGNRVERRFVRFQMPVATHSGRLSLGMGRPQ